MSSSCAGSKFDHSGLSPLDNILHKTICPQATESASTIEMAATNGRFIDFGGSFDAKEELGD